MRGVWRTRSLRFLVTAAMAAFALAIAAYSMESLVVDRVIDQTPGAIASTAGDRELAPRVAELLAFHEAQDHGDLRAMLRVAARLEAIGEPALGRHVRAAADWAVRVGWARP